MFTETKKILSVSFSLVLVLSCSLISKGLGTTGCQFLKIGMGARPLAMAGAFSAVADDVNSIYYSPASLTRTEKTEVSATYLKYFEDVNAGFIGYTGRAAEKHYLGIGLTYLNITNIQGYDVNETPLGDFGAQDTALFLNYARKDLAESVLENLSIGGGLKIINQKIEAEKAFTVAVDLSAYYPADEKLSFAFNIQNISYGVKFVDETDPLPLNIKFGAAYGAMENLTIACDLDEYVVDNKLYASVGAEYWIKEVLALRSGYRIGYDTDSLGGIVGLGAGAGFRVWGFTLDYAFVPFGDLGDTHRVSFGAKF
ncbi:MAG: PorV/PorQ family protein [Elusimicrobia bacterium]|nr:PorV/PorQ family protein [Elusimicrobiota bacterium]